MEFEPLYLQYQAADKDDTLGGSCSPQADLQNFLEESFSSQPSEYRRVGMKTYNDPSSVSQTHCSVELAGQEASGCPEEVLETIEKSVAGSKVNVLNSALEKLLKEASETLPPKPKCADNTAWGIAEVQVNKTMYEHGEEMLQEISETIERSVAPSKASGFSSALERLLKEASDTPPPKPKRADCTVQRAAVVQVKSTPYKCDGELLQEVHEIIEKSVAPSSDSGLSSALERLLKEASETPPPKPRHADSTAQGAAEVKAMSTAYEHDGELLQGIGETTQRSALSSTEYRGSDVNLQNLPKDVSETPASMLENMDKKMHKYKTSLSIHVPHQQDRNHPQEIIETIEKTSVSNKEKFCEFSRSLEKLLQEASAVSCPISRDLYQQEKIEDHTFPSEKETLFMIRSRPYNTMIDK